MRSQWTGFLARMLRQLPLSLPQSRNRFSASGDANGPSGIHRHSSVLASPPMAANSPSPWTAQSSGSSRTRLPASTCRPGVGRFIQCERSVMPPD